MGSTSVSQWLEEAGLGGEKALKEALEEHADTVDELRLMTEAEFKAILSELKLKSMKARKAEAVFATLHSGPAKETGPTSAELAKIKLSETLVKKYKTGEEVRRSLTHPTPGPLPAVAPRGRFTQ